MVEIDLLGIIYDKVAMIDNQCFVVKDSSGIKFLNQEGEALFTYNSGIDFEAGISGRVYIEDGRKGYLKCFSSTDFKRLKQFDCLEIKKIADHGFVIEDFEFKKSLVNDNGKVLIADIRILYVARSTSTADWIRVKPYQINPNDNYAWGEVRVDKEYTTTDGMYAFTTQIPGIDLVVTSDVDKPTRMRLRNNGIVVSKEYSSIIPRRNLISRRLVQVYERNGLNTYTGYIDFEGNEVVKPEYNWIQYIGNGITITKTSSGYGTVMNGKTVIKNGCIKECNVTNKGVPIHATIVNGIQFYIGNDGHAYNDVRQAFPIYKSTVCENVYLMCLYGSWIYIDQDFNLLQQDKIQDARIKCNTNWVKL